MPAVLYIRWVEKIYYSMYFSFQSDVPAGYDSHKVRLISGETTLQYSNTEFLICRDETGIQLVFQINSEYSYNPFKEALIIGNLIAVGHEGHFYLYDLEKESIVIVLAVEGYFGHLYCHDEYFYIADASGIICMNYAGKITWTNNNLAVDGVLIHEFEEDRIFGSGEWDPPGGWKDFCLNKSNGQVCL